MANEAQIRDALNDEMFVGQDSIPFDGLRLYVLVSPQVTLDTVAVAERMRLSGVYATPLPKTDDLPHVYNFFGYINPLEIVSNGQSKLISTTPLELEELIPVDTVMVSKATLPEGEHPKLVADLQEAMREVAHARRSSKKLYLPTDRLAPNRWGILRVNAQPGVGAMRPVDVRDRLLDAGYNAFAPNVGILGMFIPDSDWTDGDTWTEVLFSPGSRSITVSDLYDVFPVEMVNPQDPVGFYDVQFLRDWQGVFDFYSGAQGLETSATGAGSDIRDAIGDILEDAGKLAGAFRYLLWGAVGVGAIWLGMRGYDLITESGRPMKKKRVAAKAKRDAEWTQWLSKKPS